MERPFADSLYYQDLAQKILRLAKQHGADQAETSASLGQGFTVEVRLGEIESIQYHRDQGFDITVYIAQRKGSASTTVMTETALAETVQKACTIARATQPDDCHGLAEAERLAKNWPDLDLYHPWDITVEQATTLAQQCEQAGRQVDKRITNSEGAGITTHQGFYIYANTRDFMGYYSGSRHSVSCALVAEAQGEKQRDYAFTTARCDQDLQNAEQTGREAAAKTLARLQACKLGTRRSPVLFAPHVARSLLGHLASAIAGRQIYHQTSFLCGQLQKAVFPDFITIAEKPHLPKALGSAPFDSEGVATYDKIIIGEGRLQHYLLGSYSARKLGMQSTGNAGGVHNLILQPTTAGDLTALMKQMNTGLLVTELMGQGSNIVTGDYSRGACGFWVENGVIAYPVHEITIAGNLRDMFQHIVAAGQDLDWRSSIVSGSVLIAEMMIAGE